MACAQPASGLDSREVAAHVARHADAVCRLAESAHTGERQDMYPSPEYRAQEIEAGAGRSGLELQIDLDTSAGRLGSAFDGIEAVDAWDAVVEMRGASIPARLLPWRGCSRWRSIMLISTSAMRSPTSTTRRPSGYWNVLFRLGSREDCPKLQLTSDSGFSTTMGNVGDPVAVSGSSAQLLGWLMGRTDASTISGAEDLRLPAF